MTTANEFVFSGAMPNITSNTELDNFTLWMSSFPVFKILWGEGNVSLFWNDGISKTLTFAF